MSFLMGQKNPKPSDEDYIEQVISVIERDDVEALTTLIESETIDLNIRIEFYNQNFHRQDSDTIKFFALFKDSLECFKYLHKNPLSKMFRLSPAVHLTCIFDSPKILRYLVDELRDPLWDSNQDNDQWNQSPLYYACYHGKYEMAKFLIDRGADVNQLNSLGSVPLHSTVANGHKEVATLLIDSGSKTKLINKNDKTPAMYNVKLKNLVENWRKSRLILFLLAREKDPSSPFWKESMPRDVFVLLMKTANLLPVD